MRIEKILEINFDYCTICGGALELEAAKDARRLALQNANALFTKFNLDENAQLLTKAYIGNYLRRRCNLAVGNLKVFAKYLQKKIDDQKEHYRAEIAEYLNNLDTRRAELGRLYNRITLFEEKRKNGEEVIIII